MDSQVFSRIWTAFDAGEILTGCAWCGRVRIGDAWFPLPLAARAAIDERQVFSHSICGECFEAYMPSIAVKPGETVQEAGPERRL